VLAIVTTCKNPDEFEPDNPYDQEAPAPPVILRPVAGTVFPCQNSKTILFDWTHVSGAQEYEIQIDTSASFSTDSIYGANNPPTTITLIRYTARTTYYCRIRAGSAYWRTLYTDWSDVRVFYLAREI
jgi:hypothetical protein